MESGSGELVFEHRGQRRIHCWRMVRSVCVDASLWDGSGGCMANLKWGWRPSVGAMVGYLSVRGEGVECALS